MPLKIWARPKEDGFKALMVVPNFEIKTSDNLTHSNQVNIDSETVSPVQSKKQPSTLKVCVKGSCCKKGSRKVLAALESAIDTNQLHDVVVVEPTGCLKNCKKGPAVKLSGSGKTYTGVSPSDASKLLKHPTIAQK